MDTALVDLGGLADVPTYTRAMKGYIALSRVTKVDDLLLAQPFSPALFQQGPQPWPTLLLDVLKAKVVDLQAEAKTKQLDYKKPKMLKDLEWACDTCHKKAAGCKDFLSVHDNTSEWLDEYWSKIIAPGAHRRCWR